MKKKSVRWLQGLALTALLVASIPVVSQAATNNTSPPVPGMQMRSSQGSMITTIANVLKLSPDDLHNERLSGKSLVEIAKGKGITTDKLLDKMIANRSAQLDALVTTGRITTEEKNQYLSTMKERVTQMIKRTTTGRPDSVEQARMRKSFGNGMGLRSQAPNGQRGYGSGMNGTMSN